ncbi:MAG: hypothetical protein Q9187_002599 [Circinaria calcarea]
MRTSALDYLYEYNRMSKASEKNPISANIAKEVFEDRSHIFRVFSEHRLSSSRAPFPVSKYHTIEELLETVVRRFSARALLYAQQEASQLYDIGPKKIPSEDAFGKELYRCLFEVLGDNYVQSEWTGKDPDGKIDFRVQINENVY